MFNNAKPFTIEGFQRIHATIRDGLVEMHKPDDGDLYHLRYILATTYITGIEAVHCLRNIYEYIGSEILPLYGFNDEIFYGKLFLGDMEEALSVIHDIQFHYRDLNNYVREAQMVYYNRKTRFQHPEEVRRSIALIGMAYVELAGGPQEHFMPLAEGEWAQQNAWQYADAPPCATTGLCRMVCDWRQEGKTEQEIAERLYDKGTWCSLAQIGALLHTDNTRVSADSMKKYASRLLAKPKE